MAEHSQSLTQRDGKHHLVLEGRLDIESAARFHELAVQAVEAEGPVVLDWSRLEHLDAANAQVLLALRTELELARREFSTTAISAPLESSLRWCGILADFVPEKGASA